VPDAPSVEHERASCGIVTLADERYAPGVEMLCRSVRESLDLPIACFDLGLDAATVARLRAGNPSLEVVPMPDDEDMRAVRQAFGSAGPTGKPGKRVWPIWACPFLIRASPFQRTFWIDADIVVLRNLHGLVSMLDDGPVLTPENFAPKVTPNKAALYRLLPISRRFDPLEPRLNAGVSGWDAARDADRALLDGYMHAVRRACRDPRIAEAISWWDQGALIWAVQSCGLEHRVATTNAWNLCIRNSRAMGASFGWDAGTLDRLRELVPDANLLHWNGTPVPWLAPS
jgi:hypothetical protein